MKYAAYIKEIIPQKGERQRKREEKGMKMNDQGG